MKNLYQICKNKVTVNLPVSYCSDDIQKMIDSIANNPATSESVDILNLLISVRDAVEKAVIDGNK